MEDNNIEEVVGDGRRKWPKREMYERCALRELVIDPSVIIFSVPLHEQMASHSLLSHNVQLLA
jgi:hypothetical protein